ncbi:hypothetical protein NV391_02625 [Companilactobacillus crustorum]|uniref:hypothetical protein n=1 Tax=Companilactobacillus crustorum TaxID=392416 RepID=UPI00237ED6DA|nr:hypothetical protein [Companilactobacillus crustorum]WDT66120.1 hypothetical protein NV391_02625 [Companilactobacillus crustorum]
MENKRIILNFGKNKIKFANGTIVYIEIGANQSTKADEENYEFGVTIVGADGHSPFDGFVGKTILMDRNDPMNIRDGYSFEIQ